MDKICGIWLWRGCEEQGFKSRSSGKSSEWAWRWGIDLLSVVVEAAGVDLLSREKL